MAHGLCRAPDVINIVFPPGLAGGHAFSRFFLNSSARPPWLARWSWCQSWWREKDIRRKRRRTKRKRLPQWVQNLFEIVRVVCLFLGFTLAWQSWPYCWSPMIVMSELKKKRYLTKKEKNEKEEITTMDPKFFWNLTCWLFVCSWVSHWDATWPDDHDHICGSPMIVSPVWLLRNGKVIVMPELIKKGEN